ncbi:MAG TPA: hypothetical protein O0X25_03545 [Methanocorpusculum sp.]|nr:hypothetical protein [Methanocorpusculum sp.]
MNTPEAVLCLSLSSCANVGGTMTQTFAPHFTLDHISGDVLNTSELSLEFSWNHNGTAYRTIYSGEQYAFDKRFYYLYKTPLYLNCNVSAKWGEAVLTPGSHVESGSNYLFQNFDGVTKVVHKGSVFMDALFGHGLETHFEKLADDAGLFTPTKDAGVMALLPAGTEVHIVLRHTPTGGAVFDKIVVVQ